MFDLKNDAHMPRKNNEVQSRLRRRQCLKIFGVRCANLLNILLQTSFREIIGLSFQKPYRFSQKQDSFFKVGDIDKWQNRNSPRALHYHCSKTKSSLKTATNIISLPPPEDTVRYPCQRDYHNYLYGKINVKKLTNGAGIKPREA